jgi:hypothetical protein
MDLLLLPFYFGFCLSFISIHTVPPRGEIPDWLGGSFTPHGALLNKSPHCWIVFGVWLAVIGGMILLGFLLPIYLLLYASDFILFFLFALGIIALSYRLSSYSPSFNQTEKATDSISNYDTFRIYYSSPSQYAQLCQEPDVSSRMSETPYTFLKELPKVGLRAALRVIPNLHYQPVVREVTQKTDEQLIRLLEEIHGHADKALGAKAEMDTIQLLLTEAQAKIELIEKSESQARKDLERMQSRSRTTVGPSKTLAEMSLDELKAQRTTMMEELRKMDSAIRNLQPNPVSTATLPNLNP